MYRSLKDTGVSVLGHGTYTRYLGTSVDLAERTLSEGAEG